MILDCDLSQIEWRIAAALSCDVVMCEEIRSGVDQHAATCVDLMEMELTKHNRSSAKVFNFRMLYGNPETSWYGFYMDPQMPSFSKTKWKHIVISFFEKYAGLTAWHQKLIHEVNLNGYYTGPQGRVWRFVLELQKNGSLGYSENQIKNYIVQGTSADIIKLAAVEIVKRVIAAGLLMSKLILCVHDSLVWDTPDDEYLELAKINLDVFKAVPKLFSDKFNFLIDVPIVCEVKYGCNWGSMKELTIGD